MKIYYLKPPPSYMPLWVHYELLSFLISWYNSLPPFPHPALPQIGRFWQARPYGDWGVSWWVSMVSGRKSPCMLKVGQSMGWRLKAGQLMGWWLMFFSFWSSIVLFLRQKGLILKYLKCSLIVHHSKDRCQAFFFSISLSRLTGPIFGVTVVF